MKYCSAVKRNTWGKLKNTPGKTSQTEKNISCVDPFCGYMDHVYAIQECGTPVFSDRDQNTVSVGDV